MLLTQYLDDETLLPVVAITRKNERNNQPMFDLFGIKPKFTLYEVRHEDVIRKLTKEIKRDLF